MAERKKTKKKERKKERKKQIKLSLELAFPSAKKPWLVLHWRVHTYGEWAGGTTPIRFILVDNKTTGGKKEKSLPTAPGVPRRSPIQVLTGPDVA